MYRYYCYKLSFHDLVSFHVKRISTNTAVYIHKAISVIDNLRGGKERKILLTNAERAFVDLRRVDRRVVSVAAALGEERCKYAVNEQGISVRRMERGVGRGVQCVLCRVKPLVVDTWVSNMLH